MTWNSSCSIASDDENSRHSFLSDCDSEFDLRPPPRYPAEKRSYSTLKKQSINRIEPPMTRSRAKAIGQSVITSETLPKQKRQSTLRRSVDAFTGMASTLANSLNNNNNNNSFFFSKQEPTTLLSSSSNERTLNSPLDGVNILADRFESCSLDEGKLSRNCMWPSRETNSHYMRPVHLSTQTHTFGSNPYSTCHSSSLFAQSPTPRLFGQGQAQLWSRFRFAASTLRNNLWLEQTDLTLQQVPSNAFSSNFNNTNSLFNLNNHSSMLLSSQTVPSRLINLTNKTSSPLGEDESSSIFRQRKVPSTNECVPSTNAKENIITQQSSISKIFFTLTIFAIGLVLGYLLTNTFPPSLVYEICVQYFRIFFSYFQNMIKYFESLRLT